MSISKNTASLQLREYNVPDDLKFAVRRCFSIKSESEEHRIFPIRATGFIYLNFTVNSESLSVELSDNKFQSLEHLWLSGLYLDNQTTVVHEGELFSITLEMYPDMIYKVFGKTGVEMINRSINFSETSFNSESLVRKLNSVKTGKARATSLFKYISTIGRAYKENVVRQVLERIYEKEGAIGEEGFMEGLNISSRQVRRVFLKEVGVSPKKYARIIRINSAFEKMIRKVKQRNLSDQSGFHDQSHFIKDFKEIIGQTPYKYERNQDIFLNFYLGYEAGEE